MVIKLQADQCRSIIYATLVYATNRRLDFDVIINVVLPFKILIRGTITERQVTETEGASWFNYLLRLFPATTWTTTWRKMPSSVAYPLPSHDVTPFLIPFPPQPPTHYIINIEGVGRRRVFPRRDNLNVCMYVWRVAATWRIRNGPRFDRVERA